MLVLRLMKLILLIFIFLSSNSYAIKKQFIKWQLQITYPNYDVKTISLDNKNYSHYLPKTGWRCDYSKTYKNKISYIKDINCNFSIKKAGAFSTIISCSKNKRYNEVYLNLIDQRKDNLKYNIILSCQFIEN